MHDIFLTLLRDKKSDIQVFRKAADRLGYSLAEEAVHHLKTKKVTVETPIAKTSGTALSEDIILLPILRSGLALLPIFLAYFPLARVGFIGLKRDELTAIAQEYYRNIPKVKKNTRVVILDPMLATGGSACDTLRVLTKSGVKQSSILFVSLIAAPEGIARVRQEFPQVDLITGVVDKSLNKQKYIVPGIGDFGDRYFGTV